MNTNGLTELLFPVYAFLMRTSIIFHSRMPMIPLTFSILGGAAGAFLTYVLVQFTRVFLQASKSSGGEADLTAVNSGCIESGMKLARMSSPGGGGQPAKNEAVMRKEILTCAILGAVGLLAPFVFVMLLNSLWPH